MEAILSVILLNTFLLVSFFPPKGNSELQIIEGIEDNSKIIFFLFLNENICCDPSLEPS